MAFSPSQAGFLWDAETWLSEEVIKVMWVSAHRGFVLANLQIFSGIKQLMPRLATRMQACSFSLRLTLTFHLNPAPSSAEWINDGTKVPRYPAAGWDMIGLRKDAQSRKLGFTIDIYTLWAGKWLSTFSERSAWKSGIFRSKGICNLNVDFLSSSFWARIDIFFKLFFFFSPPGKPPSLALTHGLHPGAEQFTAILGIWQLLSPIAPWASTEGQRTAELPKMAPALDPFSLSD